ncbi:Phosphatidylinositol transfer protein 2 [Porphyridium purpureum]|uniref:Phosphatidylinositol transfer protein 2 n=1 Tax=Porphyridium purpureum TaxID=35688 RepID=A0A5J4YJK0_PORPP|nr:Phosphatidylinositol transfer protein 2 [Porphyridium purpureum]|eukprot:POR2943..scf297_16
MKIVEYRLRLPISCADYYRGQLYMVARSSMEETGVTEGEGVEIVKNEPYVDNPHGMPPGQYTEKNFYLRSHVPSFIAAVIPDEFFVLIEYSWNAFPKCLTIYENKYLGEKFFLSVETLHADDRGEQDNANLLTAEELKLRSVDVLDIADKNNGVAMIKGEDPTQFVSQKYPEHSKLKKDFAETCTPVMTAYKVVRLEFKVFGLQSKVEKWGQYYGMRGSFIKFHRKLWCWMDEWMDLSLEEIRDMEEKAKQYGRRMLHPENGVKGESTPKIKGGSILARAS